MNRISSAYDTVFVRPVFFGGRKFKMPEQSLVISHNDFIETLDPLKVCPEYLDDRKVRIRDQIYPLISMEYERGNLVWISPSLIATKLPWILVVVESMAEEIKRLRTEVNLVKNWYRDLDNIYWI